MSLEARFIVGYPTQTHRDVRQSYKQAQLEISMEFFELYLLTIVLFG